MPHACMIIPVPELRGGKSLVMGGYIKTWYEREVTPLQGIK